MATEITLSETDYSELVKKLDSGSISKEDKVVAQALVDRAAALRANEKLDDPGWYFSWTYRF